MSDNEAIVDAFVGNYESDGNWDGQPPQHADWFPGEGVRMRIYKVLMTQAGEAYAKVEISSSPARGAIERAIYRVVDVDVLVAKDIELQPGLLCKETLRVVRDPQKKRTGVEHVLEFSDNTRGAWLCPDTPFSGEVKSGVA